MVYLFNVVLCSLCVVVKIFFSLVFIFQLVGQFIARTVSDQILSKSYIEGYKGRVDCEYARYACLFVISSSCLVILSYKS